MRAAGPNDKVWAADPAGLDGYLLARIVDITADEATLEPLSGNRYRAAGAIGTFQPTRNATSTFKVAFRNIFPAEKDDTRDVDDNCNFLFY